MQKTIMSMSFILVFSGVVLAYSSLIGFSGAPGSNGTCTESCHAQNTFQPTCTISGFPENYTPGQQYIISVHHTDEPSICQFNCSVRADDDSTIAGELSAGLNTETYNTTNETNGIHWISTYNDTGTFIWTAPQAQTGSVTFYWAGLQGNRASGADQQIVFHANEEPSGIDLVAEIPDEFRLEQNYPNPFNQSTLINIYISQPGKIVLEISNLLGQRVYHVSTSGAEPGRYTFFWNGQDSEGRELPSGMYFYQLRSAEGNLTRKMTLLR